MAVYAIGDVQGCAGAVERLLEKIGFNPDSDRVWFAGDLINRGPDSLRTLRLVKSFGDSAIIVLGNHDLHFLSVAAGMADVRAGDTLEPVLRAPDCDELAQWLRHQPLLHVDEHLQTMMTHAGIYPGWRKKELVDYAAQVERMLQGADYADFLRNMYGKKPVRWSAQLEGWDRYRFIINAFTRMRYVDAKSADLDFTEKGRPGSQSKRLTPWFEHPRLRCKKWRIVFGHWSALGHFQVGNLVSLDSGCVWGGKLTAVQLDGNNHEPQQVSCG